MSDPQDPFGLLEGRATDIKPGEDPYGLLEHRYDPNAGVWNATKEGFLRNGLAAAARSFFDPNVNPFATGIEALALTGELQKPKDQRKTIGQALDQIQEDAAAKIGADPKFRPIGTAEQVGYVAGGIAPYEAISHLFGGGLPKSVLDVGMRALRTVANSYEQGIGQVFGGELGRQAGEFVGGEKGGKIGEMAGTVVGGGVVAPAASAGIRVGLEKLWEGSAFAKKLYDSATPEARAQLVKGATGEQLAAAIASEPRFEEFMSQAENVERNFPGIVLSLASRSGVESIRELKGFLEKYSLEFSRRGNEEAAKNMKMVSDYVDHHFPSAYLPLQKLANQDLIDQEQMLITRTQALQSEMEAAKADIMANRNTTAAGEKIREIAKALDDSKREWSDLNYAGVYQAGQGLVIDLKPLKTWIEGLNKTDPELYAKSISVFGRLLEGMERAPSKTEQGIEAVHSAWRELNAWRRENPGNDAKHRRGLVGEAKGMIMSAIEDAGGEDVVQALKDADTFHAGLIRDYGADTAGRIFQGRDYFGLKVNPADVVSQFVKAKGQGAKAWKNSVMMDALADDPESKALLKEGVFSMLADKLGADPAAMNPNTIRKFLRDNDDFLKNFPDLYAELRNVENVSARFAARQTELKLQKAEQQESVLRQVLNTSSENLPEKLVSFLENPVKFDQLQGWMRRNPDVRASVLRTIAGDVLQHLMNKKDTDPIEFVAKHENELRGLFNTAGPQAFDNMRNAAEALSVMRRGGDTTAAILRPKSGPIDLRGNLGVGLGSILSRFRAAEEGRVGYWFTIPEMVGRWGGRQNMKKAEALLQEAMYNPEMAEELRRTANTLAGMRPEQLVGQQGKDAWKKFKSYAAQQGIVFGVYAGDQALQNTLLDDEE